MSNLFFSMSAYIDSLIRAETDRLEREAEVLVRMGFDITELTVVCYPDGHKEVHPKEEGER